MLKTILCFLLLIVPISAFSQDRAIEARTRAELNQYTFKRDVTLQTIGSDGEVTGELTRHSVFVFDDQGHRVEKILDQSGKLKGLHITDEDWQDLRDAQMLGVDDAAKYTSVPALSASYLVEPVGTPNPARMKERYFSGTAEVNELGQIIRVRGRVLPEGKQRFAFFETLRGDVGAPFPFPTQTTADDVLHFPERDVHYRVRVRYYDYRKFATTVTVKDVDETPLAPAGPLPGFLRWRPDAPVKVFFSAGFTPEQRQAAMRAAASWAGVGGVTFAAADETAASVQQCYECLTIQRRVVGDKRHFAFFNGFHFLSGEWLEYGWIDLDPKTQQLPAVEAFVAHEIGHSLGMLDCDCVGSIMGHFKGINSPGPVPGPTARDIAAARSQSH
jgi:hypothetical protein